MPNEKKLSSTLEATKKVFHRIILLVREAAELARSIGISNLLQPGLVKELIIADILGHQPITSNPGSPDSSIVGTSGTATDRRNPPEPSARSLPAFA